MSFDLIAFVGSAIQKQAVAEILKCNEITEQYGLALSENQAAELVETRSSSLGNTGRIEFGGGVIEKIISEFRDSPYIFQSSYTSVLQELVEIFYIYKNEMLDKISDDALIRLMKHYFDGICQGSLELLKCRELEAFARKIRFGYDIETIKKEADYNGDEGEKEESENEQY